MLYNAWPDTLNHLLKESSLTQAMFAKRAGISDQTVSRWIGGHHQPLPLQLEKVAKGFDISTSRVGWIFGDMMTRHYRQGAPSSNGSSREKENEDGVRPPSIEERARALLEIDLDAVPAEIRPALRAQRNELHNLVKEQKHHAEAGESRLESLIAIFEDLYESASRIAPQH